jgi:Lar family restriction alleviation protein
MKHKMLPCPFCASKKIKMENSFYFAYVQCQKCGAEGPPIELNTQDIAEKIAADSWNNRMVPT